MERRETKNHISGQYFSFSSFSNFWKFRKFSIEFCISKRDSKTDIFKGFLENFSGQLFNIENISSWSKYDFFSNFPKCHSLETQSTQKLRLLMTEIFNDYNAWKVFKYGVFLARIFLYSDRKKLRIRTLFTQCIIFPILLRRRHAIKSCKIKSVLIFYK